MVWLLEIQKHKEKNHISERSVAFFDKVAQPIWMLKSLLRLNVQVHVIAHYA